jgi:hypothetical protein
MPRNKTAGIALRAIARDTARRSEEPIRWEGAGDYSYEMTPEGVRVTGGEKPLSASGAASLSPRTPQQIRLSCAQSPAA